MNTQWLTIELKEVPEVRLNQCSRDHLLRSYSPVTGFPGSTGHFDWLRSSSSAVVGVRYWPFEDAVHIAAVHRLFKNCISLHYVVVDPQYRFLSIFFGSCTNDFADDISNDQDLGENGIYEDQQGGIALCFEVDRDVLDSLPATPDS